MPNSDWDIPQNLQPDPDDYSFDLERALRAVVGLRANVPADAFTAGALGTERTGSGVVIREDGLVLTIGYLITEAETVWLISNDGRAVPGHALAYDQNTGFGLVLALGKLGLPALELGDSGKLKVGDTCIAAAGGGRERAIGLAEREGLSVRQLAQRLGGYGGLAFVGTPQSIADQMQEWLESRACDGFNIMFSHLPAGLDAFVDKVVPELQRRGLFRREYAGTTLREHLGLRRPANRFFAEAEAAE